MTHNNWLSTNLLDRINDPKLDFSLQVNAFTYTPLNFQDATTYTCKLIADKHSKLYIALSGGLDSEYVFRAFHKLDIPVQPVIVLCGNESETTTALKICKELKVEPVVLEVSEKEFFKHFINSVLLKYNSAAYNTTQQLLAAEYVLAQNGFLITGNHCIGEGSDLILPNKYIDAREWDFYTSNYIGECADFFMYTPEIFYALAPREHTTWNTYKAKTYGIPFREKLRPVYSHKLQSLLKAVIARYYIPKTTGVFWNKSMFCKVFNQPNKDALCPTIEW